MTWQPGQAASLATGDGRIARTVAELVRRERDLYELMHVPARDLLGREVGCYGGSGDRPATVSLYADCPDAPRRRELRGACAWPRSPDYAMKGVVEGHSEAPWPSGPKRAAAVS